MHRDTLRRSASIAIATLAAFLSLARPLAGSELRIGYPSDIVTEDPADHRDRWTEIVLGNVFDGLLTRDPSMRLVPEISEVWNQVAPQIYEFRLRSGVRLHDGRELTAEDVVFSFKRLITPGALGGRTSPRKGLLGPLATVTAVGPLAVRFELDSPWPIFPAMLPFQQIVGRASSAKAEGEIVSETAAGLIGSGPFRLVQRFPNDAIMFERHDAYFGGATDIPPVEPACVDRMVVNIVPGNESRVAGLLAGDFDIVVDVSPHSIPVLERNAKTNVRVVDGTRSFFVALNTREPPFDDPKVRRAVAHALDREQLIKEHLGGKATRIDGILSPHAFGKNKHLPRYNHDPERAHALLNEAGYPDGLDVELDVTRQLFPLAESIVVQLATVGIRAQVIDGDAAEINKKWHGGKTGKGKHMWLKSWGNASLDPVGIFQPTHRTGGRGNASGYSNSSLDALLITAATEQHPGRRADLYRRAEAIANRELPYIYLWVPKDIYGVSNRVRGFAAAPDGRLNLQDVCIDGTE
ncbi:MAG: ABC transporter substrate-binding protein [Hyphomicrobiales bacterium]